MTFTNLAVFLIFAHSNLVLARPRPCVNVRLEAERHVYTPHVTKQYVFLPLKLTYHIGPCELQIREPSFCEGDSTVSTKCREDD